jgi:hypothetical protein
MIMAALTNELTGTGSSATSPTGSRGEHPSADRPGGVHGRRRAPPDAECARDQPAPGPGAAGPGAAGPAAIDRRVWISRRTVRIDRRRRGRVRLFCGPSTATRCRGVLQMVRAGKLTYARRSIAAPAGRKHWVRIRLNRSSYRTLVKKRRARVLIELHTRGSDGVLRRGAVRTTVALARRR